MPSAACYLYGRTGRVVLAEGVVEMRWHDGSTILARHSSPHSPHLTIERASRELGAQAAAAVAVGIPLDSTRS